MDTNLAGLTILEDDHIPWKEPKPYPRKLTKYKQRTLKRWAANPKNWFGPVAYMMDNKLICNPRFAQELRERYSDGR